MSSNLAVDVHDLKSRLQWGQPAFTIIDVRDRHTYNHGHITGAIPIALDGLASRAKSSLHTERHIYIYGENDEQTTHAATLLRQAGFAEVAEIPGGFSAWKSIGGATEGIGA
ncbi:rhodanese-like domain-containing protein [Nostoc sp. UHCC 0302]|uniref:rhodanese-like domain-containing protein n=1 Tax=Nostoc sp. UHCC 0302 TaxID=3134896 RepID=UPI00311CCBA7